MQWGNSPIHADIERGVSTDVGPQDLEREKKGEGRAERDKREGLCVGDRQRVREREDLEKKEKRWEGRERHM